MQLTEAQRQQVAAWVREGAALAEIQRKLADEFKLSMTYMDVRFLVLDLGLQVKDRVSTPAKTPAPQPAAPEAAAEDDFAEPGGRGRPKSGWKWIALPSRAAS